MDFIKVVVEREHPLESPDFIDPDGCINDNNNNNGFLEQLNLLMLNQPYSLLDLGCAGGKLVVDAYNQGKTAVGLEGGNEEAILTRGAGRQNWINYKNKCLFFADISKNVDISDINNNIYKFDIITAWDFLEHPAPEEIPFVIDNIKKHLKDTGMFIGTINPSEGYKHRCARDKKWWNETFKSKGFKVCSYPLTVTPRPYVGFNGIDYAACFRLEN
jgi:2-polyprenyl-3-methyl-5-hydroxy-6-metoxy-1,4-benzoquinol methylase